MAKIVAKRIETAMHNVFKVAADLESLASEAADPHESVRLSREALFKRGIGEGFRAVLEALNGHESALQHYEALYSGGARGASPKHRL